MNTRSHIARWTAAAALAAATLAPSDGHAGDPDDPTISWADESSWDIPGEYIVDFKDEVEPSAIQSLLSSFGLSFRPTALEASTRIELVSIPNDNTGVLAALMSDPRVEHVEPLARVQAMFVPDDPMFGEQWHMSRVQAEQAWGLSVGRGATVAVVDTGIACEDFDQFKKATDLGNTRCVPGKNFISKNKPANDDHGHGTHVAGTIAQSTHNALGVTGLAFGARLMPVKVLSGNGWGTTAGVADGIRWAADNGAQVINLSLGSPRNSRVLQAAIDHARSKGAIVVAAAGNSGRSVGYPGASEGVIGVSATDASDQLAWFSSRGKGVDIAAPGVNVLQQTICDRGKNGCEIFSKFNGTSMASPHVAGAAALLVSLGVNNPAKVEEILSASAKVIDDSASGRGKYGAGLLQAASAAQSVVVTQTLTRLLALLVMMGVALRWARKKGETISAASPGLWLGGLLAGVGLMFFAPWVLSRHLMWVDVLSRPLGEWDMMIGANVHKLLPLGNALVPLALSAIFLKVKGAAPWIAGISVGTAAYLGSIAALGQLVTPFGAVLTVLWCAVNAMICLYLASLVMVKKQS